MAKYMPVTTEAREKFMQFITDFCVEETNMPYELRLLKAEDEGTWHEYQRLTHNQRDYIYRTLYRNGEITEDELHAKLAEELLSKKMFMSCMHERYGQLVSRVKSKHLQGSFFFGVTLKDTDDGKRLKDLIDAGLYEYEREYRIEIQRLTRELNVWGVKLDKKMELIYERTELVYEHERIMREHERKLHKLP